MKSAAVPIYYIANSCVYPEQFLPATKTLSEACSTWHSTRKLESQLVLKTITYAADGPLQGVDLYEY